MDGRIRQSQWNCVGPAVRWDGSGKSENVVKRFARNHRPNQPVRDHDSALGMSVLFECRVRTINMARKGMAIA